jgi:hypothetical protein
MRDAKRLVQELWETKFANIQLLETVVVEEVEGVAASKAAHVSKRAPILALFVLTRLGP